MSDLTSPETTPWFAEHDVTLYQGHVLDVLPTLPAGSVNCVVTSPPYYALRDYGVNGQIGLEPSPAEYVETMRAVFAGVRRVLREDGVLWLNLGDSYNNTASNQNGVAEKHSTMRGRADRMGGRRTTLPATLPPKNLLGIPWMVARALQQPQYVGKIRSETDRAWLAGWIDGEGTISYVERDRGPDHTPTHDIRVYVTNTDDGPLRQFAAICGGNVYVHDDGRRENRFGSRICYRWQMGTHDSALVLREIYPHLRTKRRQAALIWTLFTTLRHQNGHGPTPPAVLARRREIAEMVRSLNAGEEVTLPAWVVEPPAAEEPGWILRNAVIWAKPNAMPESVTDRLSTRYEHVFLFSRSRRYWFDLDPIREDSRAQDPSHAQRYARPYDAFDTRARVSGQPGNTNNGGIHSRPGTGKVNPGDVWTIPTQPYPGAHFATMPPKLAERCILAGCPEGGTVLDPFAGSGTTLMVARRLLRKSVGIELNPGNCTQVVDRIGQPVFDFGEATA